MISTAQVRYPIYTLTQFLLFTMNPFEKLRNILPTNHETPILPEEIEGVIQTIIEPPESAIMYAQEQLELYQEIPPPLDITDGDPVPSPEMQALTSFIEGGNVPATIGLLHITGADVPTKFDKAEEAFHNLINILQGEGEGNEIFRDRPGARFAEHKMRVFEEAHEVFQRETHETSGFPIAAGDD